MRVQADHWAVLLDFCEENPEIITNKFKGSKGREDLKQKWAELTVLLNSLGMGEKNTEEWKKTLIDWKSKTKAKAASISTYLGGTGGGPSGICLTSYEERLLNIMGKVSVYGNQEIKEIGIKRSCESQQGMSKPPKVRKPLFLTISKDQCKPYVTPKTNVTMTSSVNTNLVYNKEFHDQTPSWPLNTVEDCILGNEPILNYSNVLVPECPVPLFSINSPKMSSNPSSISQTLDGPLDTAINKKTISVPSEVPHELRSSVPPLAGHLLDHTNTPRLRRSSSTRRGETNIQISQQLQTMNDKVLEALDSININISQIGIHLADLVKVIRDLKN